MIERIKNHWRTLLIGVLLLATTLAVFWQARHFDFINCDDQDYVLENPAVQGGLSWTGIVWAFTSSRSANWHPLTWLSHMVDCQLYGLNAGGHHLTSVLWHGVNTLLLFLLLRRMTGSLWRSAFVAALFGLHPLHVESVVWISERKDVLSTFFFLLTLLTYSQYARASQAITSATSQTPRPAAPPPSPHFALDAPSTPHSALRTPHSMRSALGTLHAPRSFFWYALTLLCFALGLMSKPMLVTLPFVLLLLDYWPLQRLTLAFSHSSSTPALQHSSTLPLRLILEKLPFIALAAASCVITIVVQHRAGAVATFEQSSLGLRVENALVSYLRYLIHMLWPQNLAACYPLRSDLPDIQIGMALVVLTGVSMFCYKQLKHRPSLAVGWLWFLGTLVPVIGFVQVGSQAMADRYTYIPLIGPFIALTWGLAEVAGNRRSFQLALGCGAIPTLAALSFLSYQQTTRWKDSETLFRYVLSVTTDNAMAHESLGNALAKQNKIQEASLHFTEAIRIRPTYAEAIVDYGLSLVMQGKVQEGIDCYRQAIALKPGLENAHFNLARALTLQAKGNEAVQEYRTALELNPNSIENKALLAAALADIGRIEESAKLFAEVIRLNPKRADTHFAYASMLYAIGHVDESQRQFQEALQLAPQEPEFHRRYGLLLARTGKTNEAIEQFRDVLRLRPTPEAHYNLALALLVQGQPTQAAPEYREALRLNPDYIGALNDLAWLLATRPEPEVRNGAEAVNLAQHACELSNRQEVRYLGTLDAAYAEAGDFTNAITTAELVRSQAAAAGQTDLAEQAEQRLTLYRAGKPFHQPKN